MALDITYLSASDGTDDAALMHVQANRAIGSTTLQVDTVSGVPAKFIATTGSLDSDGFIDPSSKVDFYGHLDGSNLEIDGFCPGNADGGNVIGEIVVIKPNTSWANLVAQSMQDLTDTVDDFIAENGDWRDLGANPNSVTSLGNRSYQLAFNGIDLTTKLSPKMRMRTKRTSAAPIQSASLNGTNQYFNKTTPAGMTFTDDFTVSAWVKLSSYAAGIMTIASRYNGTSGWQLQVQPDGRVQLIAENAGAGNSSYVISAQSLPLNRWVHITAQLDMSAFTATTATSYIMLDGVDVPCSVARGGTSPTTLVQAGNLEIGSQNGGTLPFPGKIAQAAVFSAKVLQATALGYMNQGLAGNESNGAAIYSLSNSINDLTANANNLTAQNGAVATNADSPFGTQGDGSISSTLDYGIIMSASYAGGNTTVVVQVAEGCTIPTSGTLDDVVYSTVDAPYRFPSQKRRWQLETLLKVQATQASASAGTWYNLGPTSLSVPIGAWSLAYEVNIQQNASSTGDSAVDVTLSTANNSDSDNRFYSAFEGNSVTIVGGMATRRASVYPTVATPYYLNTKPRSGTGTLQIYNRNELGQGRILAENEYL